MGSTRQAYGTLGWRTEDYDDVSPYLHMLARTMAKRGHNRHGVMTARGKTDTLTAQTHATHPARINDPPMTETRRTKIHSHSCWHAQQRPRRPIRHEPHHQILQQPLRPLQLYIRPLGRIRRLLQEHRIPRDLAYINRDVEALAGEDGVHDGYILGC